MNEIKSSSPNEHKKYCRRILKQYGKNLKKSNHAEYERFKAGAEL